jgi:hypothetical protein
MVRIGAAIVRLVRCATTAAVLVASSAAPDALAADVQAKPGYQIQCFEDPATLVQFCFAPAKLTANGNVRASPLYAGKGPDLSLMPLTAVADCKKSTVTLRDAKGVTPRNAPAIEPRVAEALARDMCAVTKPAVDKKLKL